MAVQLKQLGNDPSFWLGKLIDESHLPTPEREYRFWEGRQFRFDFCWVKQRIACEVEGQIWLPKGAHNTGRMITKDIIKYNEAALLGWLVIRVTPKMIETGEAMDLLVRAFLLRTA